MQSLGEIIYFKNTSPSLPTDRMLAPLLPCLKKKNKYPSQKLQ